MSDIFFYYLIKETHYYFLRITLDSQNVLKCYKKYYYYTCNFCKLFSRIPLLILLKVNYNDILNVFLIITRNIFCFNGVFGIANLLKMKKIFSLLVKILAYVICVDLERKSLE